MNKLHRYRSRMMARVRVRRRQKERDWPTQRCFWEQTNRWISMSLLMARRDGWHPMWQGGYALYEYPRMKAMWLCR